MRTTCALLFTALALCACAPLPIYTALPVDVRPSPNFGERRPNYVILHHTSSADAERGIATLTSRLTRVSAHYLVTREGRIVYLVDERMRAWHAGESYWGGNRDLNSSSIGIELDNDGEEAFAEPQVEALLALLADLRARWGIPAANVLGHGDVAPGRKVDPSRRFPWKRLAARGFGLWCDPPYDTALAGASDEILLAALGYDVSTLPAAVAAFERHYTPEDDSTALTEAQRGMLQCLIRKEQAGDLDIPQGGQ